MGLAVGYKNVGFSEGFDDSRHRQGDDERIGGRPGSRDLHRGGRDGTGPGHLRTQVARTELQIENVVMHPSDTLIGNAGSTSASRQSMMAGGAVQMACASVRSEIFARASARSISLDDDAELSLSDGWVSAGGLPVVEMAELLDEPLSSEVVYHHRPTQPFDENGQGDIHVCFAFGAERAVVEVDEEAGWSRCASGCRLHGRRKVLDPIGLTGQIEGGTAQGLGLALMEEVQLRQGVIANPSFTDYLIPTILDVPPVVSVVVDTLEPGVAYGLKGMGESPTVGPTAAVVAVLRVRHRQAAQPGPGDTGRPDRAAPAGEGGPPAAVPTSRPQSVPFYFAMGSGQQKLM